MTDSESEMRPSKTAYFAVFVIGLAVFGFLFYRYGFLDLPAGSAQQIAAYFGTRLLPIGVAVTLIGLVVALATNRGDCLRECGEKRCDA